MAKKLSVTVSNWIFDDMIENRPVKSRSEWIEKLIVLGYQAIQEKKKPVLSAPQNPIPASNNQGIQSLDPESLLKSPLESDNPKVLQSGDDNIKPICFNKVEFISNHGEKGFYVTDYVDRIGALKLDFFDKILSFKLAENNKGELKLEYHAKPKNVVGQFPWKKLKPIEVIAK